MSDLLQTLLHKTGLLERDLVRIISNAPRRYKEYRIPKRTGGFRQIAQPARELKALQRVLISEYLDKQPVHSAAMAYRTGLSIRSNALAHVENGPILKMDFKEFFPSIRVRDWVAYCHYRGIFKDVTDLEHSSRILFQKRKGESILRLAIGAPSSPMLSNILMFEFDALVTDIVQQDHVTYTRYADDLTFSAKRTGYLNSVQKAVAKAIREVNWPRLTLNKEKTVVATTRYHRQVTGLVLTNDHRVSLGHDRKRKISAAVHHASVGRLTEQELKALAGQLAFAFAVEPDFLSRLQRKYGVAEIDRIKRLGKVLI